MTHKQIFRHAFDPLQTALRSTPVIALSPPLALWLGFGVWPKVVMATIITFPPLLLNASTGFRLVDDGALELFHSVNASPGAIFLRLRLPNAMPYLLTALKVSISLALIGAVVAEWSASSEGLGYRIVRAQKDLETVTVWGAVAVLATMGIVLTTMVGMLERHLMRNRTSFSTIPD